MSLRLYSWRLLAGSIPSSWVNKFFSPKEVFELCSSVHHNIQFTSTLYLIHILISLLSCWGSLAPRYHHLLSYTLNSLVSFLFFYFFLLVYLPKNSSLITLSFLITLDLPHTSEWDWRKTHDHADYSHLTHLTTNHKWLLSHPTTHSVKFSFPLSKIIANTIPFSLNIKYLFLLIILTCYLLFSLRKNKPSHHQIRQSIFTSSLIFWPHSCCYLLCFVPFVHWCSNPLAFSKTAPAVICSVSPFFCTRTESLPKAYKHSVISFLSFH